MTVRQRGRPREHTIVLREAELIETAFALFRLHGYHAVSLAMVAAEAHVAVRTIYAMTGGKAGLLRAMVEREHRRHQQQLLQLERPSALEQRLHVLAVHLLARSEDPVFRALQPLVISEGSSELANACYQAGPGQFIGLLTAEIAGAQHRGSIGGRGAAGELATLFVDLIKGEELARFFVDGALARAGTAVRVRPARFQLFLDVARPGQGDRLTQQLPP